MIFVFFFRNLVHYIKLLFVIFATLCSRSLSNVYRGLCLLTAVRSNLKLMRFSYNKKQVENDSVSVEVWRVLSMQFGCLVNTFSVTVLLDSQNNIFLYTIAYIIFTYLFIYHK